MSKCQVCGNTGSATGLGDGTGYPGPCHYTEDQEILGIIKSRPKERQEELMRLFEAGELYRAYHTVMYWDKEQQLGICALSGHVIEW